VTKKLNRLDHALLESAWAELARAPRACTGTHSSTRSGLFRAWYPGICNRCGFPITVGQDIRFHRDFDRFVHNGCRAPTVTVRMAKPVALRQPRTAKEMTAQQPPLCPECHLEHAGVCW